MKKFIGVALVIFLLFSPSLIDGKKTEKFTFDAKAAWTYIKEMSADEMEGRRSGQPGGVMGEDYIASKFKEWGLEPAGDDGTYFQNFTIEHRHIEEGVELEIITKRERRDFYYGDTWRIQRYSGSGNFTAEIVFVGYGIHAPDKKYDDYAGVDVKGKVVLFAAGSPRKLADKLGDAADTEKKIEAAQELGARGIIAFRRTSTQDRFYGIRVRKEQYKPDFVILSIESSVTNFIFKDLKTETRYLYREIDDKAQPQSFATGVKAFISVNASFDEKRPTRNVLAKITGRDKKLKDEYVVIGGHMDHLGISPLGDVYNGANDNASGTAVAMEIARVMKLNKAKPKRTVVFAGWAGEEQGLIGSRHYADNSPSVEKTIAYINMDMVGHGSGNVPFRGEYYGPHIWKLLKEKLPKEIMEYVKPGRGGPGGSDHTPFLQKGVPAFAVMTEGYHFKYHRPGDDIDLIKPEILKRVGDFVYAAVQILASEPGDFIQPIRQEMFYLKYQDLANFKFEPLTHVIEKHGDAKNSHVDLQVAVVEGKAGLSGNDLRIDIINRLLDLPEKMKKAKGLSLYAPNRSISRNSRQGKTTVLLGLNGLDSVRDNPKWAKVLVEQGIHFAVTDDLSFLFGEEGLAEDGKTFIKAVNSSGLLLLAKGLDAFQMRVLLEGSKKPMVFIERKLPDEETLEMIKEKNFALGLVIGADEDPAAYFKKLEEAKKALGSRYLMIVNENCL
ncbi:MAG: M20/M25/M40 family metallo-hydrolase, partial [Candidatus Aminicenantes bacterium]